MVMLTQRTVEVFSGFEQTRGGLYVPEAEIPPAKPVGIDLFAGAGGFSLGFHQAGIHVAAALEFDLYAACTYMCNLAGPDTMVHVGPGVKLPGPRQAQWPIELGGGKTADRWSHRLAADVFPDAGTGWIAKEPNQDPCEHMWICNINDITGQDMLDWLELDRGDVGSVFGGPPCQGFSRAGKRSVMDPRNSLVFEFVRIVLEILPKTMCMENVVGILDMVTPEGIPVIDALARVLADGGFSTYDAMRKSLQSMAGSAGAVRQDGARTRKSNDESEPLEGALW